METKTHYKFIQWRDTGGLHEDTTITISDLKFLQDELHFLTDLASEETLEMIYGISHEASAFVAEKLQACQNRVEHLLEAFQLHSNRLQTLLDDTEIPNELEEYKDAHYNLMISAMKLHGDVKKVKQRVFNMLAEVMQKSKEKRSN
ncbi:MAG: hypothetical protein R3359_01660 [Marinirhabdus sp.]|nr:hypothetical protein [Marinirhabdus sp.]